MTHFPLLDTLIQPGARVRVMLGEHQGATGVVVSVDGATVLVRSDRRPDLTLPFYRILLQTIPHIDGSSVCGIHLSEGERAAQQPTAVACAELRVTTERACAELKAWAYTEQYLSHGIPYYRFRWGKGGTTAGYQHIPGGSADSDIAQERRGLVDGMVQRGCSVAQVRAAIAAMPQARQGRKPF